MSQISGLYLYFIAVIGYVLTPVSCPRLECNYTLRYIYLQTSKKQSLYSSICSGCEFEWCGRERVDSMATAKHYCAVRPSLSIQTLQIVNLQTSGSAVNWTLMVWENIPTRCFEDSNNERWRWVLLLWNLHQEIPPRPESVVPLCTGLSV